MTTARFCLSSRLMILHRSPFHRRYFRAGIPYLAKLPVVHHDGFSCEWPEKHRFKMAKFVKVMEWIVKDNLLEFVQVFQPTEPCFKAVTRVHGSSYVTRLIQGSLPSDEMRKTGFHWSKGLINRCLLEVGGTMLAAKLAVEHGLACSTGGGTHHAFPSHGSGFCLLNDLAVTAKDMVTHNVVHKILIVDLDVHQGDGTAFIFKDDNSVFTFSMHCEKNFPLRKQQSDLDVGLECGLNDKQYLNTLMEYLPWLLDTYRPDLVLYDAGVDPHQDDELGRLNLTDQGLFDRDVAVIDKSLGRGIPCAAVIGGGYDNDVDVLSRRHSIIHRAALKVWNNRNL
ncbi:uncharacterized protein SYNPCC7002_A1628-like [Montipora capricornis]|uniref:uncharacterized protein SYNPCC7002_A1628-like n=1 Tax=Montipora capricornis TaxID=246305 RepID=UPI0035F1695E